MEQQMPTGRNGTFLSPALLGKYLPLFLSPFPSSVQISSLNHSDSPSLSLNLSPTLLHHCTYI